MKKIVKKSPKIIASVVLSGTMLVTQIPFGATQTVYANVESSFILEDYFNRSGYSDNSETSEYVISAETGSVKIKEISSNDKSLFLEDTGDKNTVVSKEFHEQTEKMSFAIDFMQPELGSTAKVVRLMDGNNNTAVHIETRSGGVLAYKLIDDSFVELIKYEKETWYTIQINADITKQNADIFVNGKMLAEDIPFYKSVSGISKFDTFTPGSGVKSHYIDDLQIYSKEVLPVVSEKASGVKVQEVLPVEVPPTVVTTTPTVETTPILINAEDYPTVYEAEDAILEGVIIDTKHSGFSGTGFTDYSPNAPGGTILWNVLVPTDGTYELTFRYAHGASDERPAEIKVNGEVVAESLAFDSTGEWNNWQTTSTKVKLVAGKNTIIATGVGVSGGANIDSLTVLPVNEIVLEAEDAKLEGVIIDTKHSGYSGTGFTDYSPNAPGGTIEWSVNIPVASQYKLTFRYAHGASDERPAEIKVNGEVIVESLAFDSTGEWNNWQTTSTIVDLVAGENTIIATGVGVSGGANIDNVTLQPVFDVIYEAEDAVLEGVITDTKHSGYTGSSFTDYSPNAPGGFIEWTVNVPVANEYALQFRYAHGGSDERPAEIKVNGQVAVESLAFDPTGEWNNWQNSTATVRLEAGTNTIRATAISASGGGNIDHLRVISKNLLNDSDGDQIVMKVVDVSEIVYPILAQKLYKEGLLNNVPSAMELIEVENVEIETVNAVTSDIVLVTLNTWVENFDPYDIMISVPTSAWTALNPNFTYAKINKMAVSVNSKGNTVLVYELTDSLNEDGAYTLESKEETFKGDVEKGTERALNMISMQLSTGGWYKNADSVYDKPWDGESKRAEWFSPTGEELATIDNDATISEIKYIAEIYNVNPLPEFKTSIEKGIDFLFLLQYETGGFAQVYPRRGTEANPSYSDFVTFNDNAMINVLSLYDDILKGNYPFNSLDLSPEYITKIENSKADAIKYILEAQIEANGVLTAWCAQHDPYTYEAVYARAYEHPSISGMESAGIIKYLMSIEPSDEINASIKAALKWYDDVKVADMRYVSGDKNDIYFYESKGNNMWYRFYEIGTNTPIFSGRDGIVRYDLLEVEEERRNGYSWAGDYASGLLKVANEVGFYENKIYAEVVNNKSTDTFGKTLVVGDLVESVNILPSLQAQASSINVSKEEGADFNTVQEAINFIPENNVLPVNIYIADGIYKEVINVPVNKPYINLIGESKEGTILTFDNYAGKDNGVGGTIGTSGSASVYIYGNDFKASNITFENSFDESTYEGKGTQAVAVYAKGQRQSFSNCSFIGNQDTLYVNDGTQYFYNCYIEGDVDFIFGASSAVFDSCVIFSIDKGSDTNNGYITAASTSINKDYGFLFINCQLLSDAKAGSVYLGRPWHPSGDVNAIASVTFRECLIGSHINPDGYTSMSGFEPEGHRYFGYANFGDGAVDFSRGQQLDSTTEKLYTIQNVLGGWNPVK